MRDAETRTHIRDILFGYDTLVYRPEIVALEGPSVSPLRKGMVVTLQGDSMGYIPGGFRAGQIVTIIGFYVPFDDGGSSDNVVVVSDGTTVGGVKPRNVIPLECQPVDLLSAPPVGAEQQ